MKSVHAPDVLGGGSSSLWTAFVKSQTLGGGLSGTGLRHCRLEMEVTLTL